MLLGQRKEIVETILLQKCLSAGEQETKRFFAKRTHGATSLIPTPMP